MPGDAVKMLGSLEPTELPPGGQGLASSLHRHVDILRCALGGRGQDFARGRGLGLVLLPTLRVVPGVVDEEPKLPIMVVEPVHGHLV